MGGKKELKQSVADIDIVNIRRVREMIKTSNQNANQHHEEKGSSEKKYQEKSVQVCKKNKKKMIKIIGNK